jgi:hypothetical protein
MEKKMYSNKKTARIVGALFIIATVAGFISAVFLAPILEAPDDLAKVSANENQVLMGALFIFIMGAAGASIAIALYPVLSKHNKGIALGSVGFRIIEGALFMVGVIYLLLLVALSQEFAKAGAPDASYFQTSGKLMVGGLNFSLVIGGLAFSLAALLYYYLFYRTRLIPRWLSIWGLLGVTLGLAEYLNSFFSASASASSGIDIGHIPLFLQEMVLAVWLIVKGFNPSAISSGSAKTDINEV